MADAGVHPGSAAGRALTAQDHSLVALITRRVLLLCAKHLFAAAKSCVTRVDSHHVAGATGSAPADHLKGR